MAESGPSQIEGTAVGLTLNSSTFKGIEWPDYLVTAIYFVSVLLVGVYVIAIIILSIVN